MAWLTGFTNRLKITIPSDNIDSTLTDFPILLKLTTDCGLTGFDASLVFDELELDANRFKIAVTASDGTTQRYVEIEKWDDSSEEAWLWVKVPSVAATGKTELYFYYDSTASDNTTYVGDIASPAGTQVWTNGFYQVYHLGDASGPLLDSTTTSGHLTVAGTYTLATPAKIAEGMEFSTTAYAFNNYSAFSPGHLTVETWVKPDSVETSVERWVNINGSLGSIGVLRQDSGTAEAHWYIRTGGALRHIYVSGVVTTDWAYYVGTWDGTTQTIYKNGAVIGAPTTPGGVMDQINQTLVSTSSSEWFDGLMDEVRVSTTGRNASWVKATYYTCNDDLLYMEEDVTEAEWLGTWENRITLTIDKDKVDENVIDFPVLVKISSASGITSTNLRAFFNELTLSSGVYNKSDYEDDFTGTNGDTPDPLKWEDLSSGMATIQSNKLRFSSTSYATVRSYFKLSGDFDVQVDFSNLSGETADFEGALITAYVDSENSGHIRAGYRTAPGISFDGNSEVGDVWGAGGTVSRTNSYGKLRIDRSGTTWRTRYQDGGGGWTQLYSQAGGTGDVQITFSTGWIDGTIVVDFDNFTINSGHVIYDVNRKKVAFTTENGTTQCYAELDLFDTANEEVFYWVKVPVVSNNEDTILYLYYDSSQSDNSSYVGDTGDAAAQSVWDDNFAAVYHLSQNPSGGSGSILDSTLVNDGTPNNMEGGDLIDGQAGKALNFDGSNESVTASDDSSLNPTSGITVDVLMKKSSNPGTWKYLMHKGTAEASSQTQYQIVISSAGVMQFGSYINSVWETSNSSAISNDEYHHIAGKYDGSNISIFRDSTEEDLDSASGSILSTAGSLAMGSSVTGNYFTGVIDEVRISDVGRSDAWIKSTYYTFLDNLISFGAPETEPAPSVGTFNGYVKLAGEPVARTVQLYRRSTGELQDSTISNPNTGYFEVETIYDELHYLVILPELSDGYQPIAQDQIDPV